VKFVKPVVAKAEEVVEEPPKIKEIVDKKLGAETIKGDPDAELTVEPVGNGDVVEEDNSIYNTAGIEVKPDFPGGMEKFYKFVGKNYQVPEEEGLKGKVFVSFVVEKDGSLTDIKVIRDIGYGTGKEAIRVLKSCPRWNPGEQNGKKVRVLYSLPINIQSAE
jgi:protein TonB